MFVRVRVRVRVSEPRSVGEEEFNQTTVRSD